MKYSRVSIRVEHEFQLQQVQQNPVIRAEVLVVTILLSYTAGKRQGKVSRGNWSEIGLKVAHGW